MMPGSLSSNDARASLSIAEIPRVVMNVALPDDLINLCHLNAQSLCARQLGKLDEFKSCFVNSKLDIICVTETWLQDSISDSTVGVEGYTILRNDRNYSRGGGVCIYYKNGINCKQVAASEIVSDSRDFNRTEYLFVEIFVNQIKFLLGIIYCPPGVDCSWVLEQKLSELSLNYENIILLGDFNTNSMGLQ